MKRCEICGSETKDGKKICQKCYYVLQVAKKKEKARNIEFIQAEKHLQNNPGLFCISWPKFLTKKR